MADDTVDAGDPIDTETRRFHEQMFRYNHPAKAGTPCKNPTDPGFTTESIGNDPVVMNLIRGVASGKPCRLHASQASQEAEIGRVILYAITAAEGVGMEKGAGYLRRS